jgi:hypothetical protein
MKVRINKHDTACVVVGYYDGTGEYREELLENVILRKMDKSIARNVDLSHDITLHIVPGIEVRAFAKSRKDIETCLEIEGDRNYFKTMLDVFSKHNKSVNGEYIYTTYEFEERRRACALPPLEL